MWFHPMPRNYDLNKFKFTLHGNVSKQVSAFLATWFMRRFLKDVLFVILCKTSSPIVAHTIPRYNDLNNLKSKKPEDVSIKSLVFLVFVKNIFSIYSWGNNLKKIKGAWFFVNRLKSLFPTNTLCQVWIKLVHVQWF